MTYPRSEFEVIVVDDGASTETAAVVSEFESVLTTRYVARDIRQGPARARNEGAALAMGRYIAFLDDDCVPAPDWLMRYDEAIDRYPNEAAIFGGRTLNADGNSLYGIASQQLIDFLYEWFNADSEHGAFFATNNMVCPRAEFLASGGFDESFRFAAAEDRDLCDRWCESEGRLVYVPSSLVHHHQRATLGGFVRQHTGYGRGAVDLHRARDRRGVHRPKLEPMSFYFGLVVYPARRVHGMRVPALMALAALSQAAYAFGFFRERLRRRDDAPSPPARAVRASG